MKAELYTLIKRSLLEVTELRGQVKLWHNTQINNVDTIASYPFAVVQFGIINYEDMTLKQQEAPGYTFTVHIIEKSLTGDEERLFNVTQEVYKKMRASGFFRKSEQPIYEGGEIIDWQIIFEAPRFEDYDAMDATTSRTKSTTDIEPIIQIDSPMPS